MNQKIDFVVTERIPFSTAVWNAYELRTDRSLVWLQRILFHILGKIGAYKIDTTFKMRKYEIKPLDFMQRIFEQKTELLKTFDIRPNKMYIGSEDYYELMNYPEIKQSMEPIIFDTGYNYGQSVMGLKVHIIPWMSGILLVKEEK